jgi:hypothetical protein
MKLGSPVYWSRATPGRIRGLTGGGMGVAGGERVAVVGDTIKPPGGWWSIAAL